jgi:ABC-2 type transport system permease protein
MKAFFVHLGYEFRTAVRNKSLLFVLYLFPLMLYLLMGSLMAAMNPSFRESMIPSMCTIAMMTATMMALPGPLVAARETGILRSYKINGVPAASILFVPALAAFFHFCLLGTVITVTAPILFDAPLLASWPAFLLLLLLTFLASAGIGMLIGIVSTSAQMCMLLVNIIFVPAMMLGGLMFPHAGLPKTLGKIAMLLPTTYQMNAMRALALNQPVDLSVPWSIVILLVSGLLSLVFAIRLFRWDINEPDKLKTALMAVIPFLPYVAGMLFL